MDSIKIIKKHGQPGGLPVVTVYVDENAPGETDSTLYAHYIKDAGGCLITIISKDNTPFTAVSLGSFLYENGINSADNAIWFPTSPQFSNTAEGVRYTYRNKIWGTSGASSNLKTENFGCPITYTDNKIVAGDTTGSTVTISNIKDTIIEIK